GLFGPAVPDPHGPWHLLCARPQPGRRHEAGRMSGVSNETAVRRRSFDGWRWAGRIFLVFMLIYTVVPMAWMFITSLKSGFAAMHYPTQWWPAEPTLYNYAKLLDPQNSIGQDFLR